MCERLEELNLASIAQHCATDETARAVLESLRWPTGPVCPHCQNCGTDAKGIAKLAPKADSKEPGRQGLYFCGACRKQFSVTVGTVMQGSHLPIRKWLMAMFILCSSKKAVSAHQLHRMLDTTYRAAWFMAHRLRHAMQIDNEAPKLDGVVECDETFIGPRSDTRHSRSTKANVAALVQRNGQVRTRIVSSVSQKLMRIFVTDCVSKDAVLNTDEHAAYRRQFRDFKRHDVVCHRRREYSRTNKDGSKSGINHCESFFSLFKRSIVGSWHHISKEHLERYANEVSFRWNSRNLNDGERMKCLVPMMKSPIRPSLKGPGNRHGAAR